MAACLMAGLWEPSWILISAGLKLRVSPDPSELCILYPGMILPSSFSSRVSAAFPLATSYLCDFLLNFFTYLYFVYGGAEQWNPEPPQMLSKPSLTELCL